MILSIENVVNLRKDFIQPVIIFKLKMTQIRIFIFSRLVIWNNHYCKLEQFSVHRNSNIIDVHVRRLLFYLRHTIVKSVSYEQINKTCKIGDVQKVFRLIFHQIFIQKYYRKNKYSKRAGKKYSWVNSYVFIVAKIQVLYLNTIISF